MEQFGIAGVAVITVIVYVLADIIKATPLPSKWLPAICGVLGGVLGIVGMLTMPGFPAQDILSAIAVGAVSGWAATGVHETTHIAKTE